MSVILELSCGSANVPKSQVRLFAPASRTAAPGLFPLIGACENVSVGPKLHFPTPGAVLDGGCRFHVKSACGSKIGSGR